MRAEAATGLDRTRFQAADVLPAVEVVSPDSEARGRDTKPHKYAAAGIPNFWLVELAEANQQPLVRTFELDPVTRTYGFTGTHRDLLDVDVPYGIDIDITPEALDAL